MLKKNNFRYHGNHKTVNFWWFSLFFRIFLLPPQGFGGGSPRHGSCNTLKWPSSQPPIIFQIKSLKKIIFVTMVTIKLYILDDFLYFLGFSCFHSRGLGSGAPNMGQVIHRNKHLVTSYHFKRKQIILVTMATPKSVNLGWFSLFFGFSCSHLRGSWAGAPNMGHVIHQNDHLIKLYHIQKKKLKRIVCNLDLVTTVMFNTRV